MRIGVPAMRRYVRPAAILSVVGALVWLRCGPLPAGLLDVEQEPSTVLLDRHGERLYEARADDGLRGEWIEDGAVPPLLERATLAAEDIRFDWHAGVDPLAIARAMTRNVRALQVREGGSTITQQVAKLLLARRGQRPARGVWRAKIGEAVIALRLEHRLSKQQILALYLNLAPYGNQIQGAQRAARAYFGRDLRTLTVAETAFLAALPQQPGRFNPWTHPERVARRQGHLIAVMAARHWITAEDASAARAERLILSRDANAFLAPHFVARVRREVAAERPRRIQTTLDASLQRTVQGIIAAERATLVAHHADNVAVAVMDNRTGDWLAWEGSGDYFDTAHGGTLDGVISPRQPGSALKPFTYAAAFERGLDPGHVLADVPSQFATAETGVLYRPRNYDGRFRGPLLARAALAGSENVPAVALAAEIGVPTVARLLRRAGFSTLDRNAAHYGLGLTLGNAEVRLDELVAGYAAFARGGDRVTPRMVLALDGTPRPAAATERLVSLRTAFWITDVLSDADARAYVFGRGGSLEFPFTVAAKTGTSQSYFDNWAVGYTAEVTVGVWVGNFDRTPLRGSSGVTGAGPIFHAVMLAAVQQARGFVPTERAAPIVAPPADVQRAEICATSGMPAGDACPARVMEWLPAAPTAQRCTWHHASDEGLVTVWPDVFREWARQNGRMAHTPLPGTSAGLVATPITARSASVRLTAAIDQADDRALRVTRPLAGAIFLLDPTLRPEFQTIALVAAGGDPGRHEWFVDGRPIGADGSETQVRWPLSRGRHDVSVVDARGHVARTTIDVR
ncbi:MAG: penicillin-binding protein 1C [Vicinamibacterales bacterium]